MVFALIDPNMKIVEIGNIKFPVNPALVWSDISAVMPKPLVGWSASNSNGIWSFTAPLPPPPPPPLPIATQAQIALQAGLTIVSTSDPDIFNATYSLDMNTQLGLLLQAGSLAISGNFANGLKTIQYPDAKQKLHTFTIVQFQALAAALNAYIAELNLIIVMNTGTLPSATVTIA